MSFKPPIDLGALKPQFELATHGDILLIDGDGPAYVAAASAKTLPTALRRYQQRVLELMFLARCSTAEVHLTDPRSYKMGRFGIKASKRYQHNRVGKEKPALLELVRQGVLANPLPEYTVFMHTQAEADDGVINSAYTHGERAVVWSDDKDLRMTPYRYYCKATGNILPSCGFGEIAIALTPSGAQKPSGHGRKFFWFQMLMGDTADGVVGLKTLNGKRCGLVNAYNFLWPIKSEDAAANAVLDQYRKIDQNPIAEGWLLWLTRSISDSVWAYFTSLDLSPENKEFLTDCLRRDWFDPTATDDPCEA